MRCTTKRSLWRFGQALVTSALLVVAMVFGSGTAHAAANGNKQITIAMVTHAQPGDVFWDEVRKGAEAAAKNDNVKLEYLHGESPQKQAAKLRAVIAEHVDGIALTLAFPTAMKPLVKQAQAAHIPIVAFNSGFKAWKAMGIPMYVGQSETLAGEHVGEWLNKHGYKHVMCVNQQQGAVQLAARCHGIQKTFKGKESTVFVEGYNMSAALARIQAKLIQDPGIDVIVTLGSPFAPTALKAVKAANSKAKVGTFDLNSLQIGKLVKNGELLFSVDQQPYLEGYEAVDLLWLNITNGDILGAGRAALTGPTIVDASNIDKIMPFIKRGTR